MASPPPPLAAVEPRFRLLRRLGEGGMGVVYEAIDAESGQKLAVKMLKRTADADAILRLKNEFRALHGISHPNLVQLGELVLVGDQWLLTMELVEGVDFIAHVRPGEAAEPERSIRTHSLTKGAAPRSIEEAEPEVAGGLDEARLRGALVGLTDGLDALHGAGKVHRDVKPSNVLVTTEGRVVLLDFGLVADQLEVPADRIGTARYAAPELYAGGKAASPASDWYAVGVMLYRALAGRFPPQAEARSPPGVPDDLASLCASLLDPRPEARPGAAEVRARLGLERSFEATPREHFVGRSSELRYLFQALERTRGEGPVALVIEGESGVGKSALMQRFVRQAAAERGALVFAGRCHERESVPYKAVDGAIDAVARYLMSLPPLAARAHLPLRAGLLGYLFPVLRGVDGLGAGSGSTPADPFELRSRAYAALRELFARLSEQRPVVIAIDDLQWTDEDSLLLLSELLRPPDAPSVLLLSTFRTEPSPGGYPQPAAVRCMEALRLTGLATEDARSLAGLFLTRTSDTEVLAAEIAAEAAGHPFFIRELAKFRSRSSESAPSKLSHALRERIDRLDPLAKSILELSAIGGVPLPQETIARAAGVGLEGFLSAKLRLTTEMLARDHGPRASDVIEPMHDRVRAAVLESLDPAARQDRARSLAEAMEGARAPDSEVLASLWIDAERRDKAAAHALRAARRASQALAFDRGARLYGLVLELDASREGRNAIQVELAHALANAGRGAQAGRAFLAAAALETGQESRELERRAAEQYLRAGHVGEGLQTVLGLLHPLGLRWPRTPRRALISLAVNRARLKLSGLELAPRAQDASSLAIARADACWSVGVGLAIVDLVRGADFQARSLLYSLRAGDPYRVARALAHEAGFIAAAGRSSAERANALLRTADELAHRSGNPHAVGMVRLVRGLVAFVQGRWRPGTEMLDEAADFLRDNCTGVDWELNTARVGSLICLYYLGEIVELSRRVPPLLGDADRRGDLLAAASLRGSHPSVMWLAADDPSAARSAALWAAENWSGFGFSMQHFWSLLLAGEIELYSGDHDACHRLIEARWPDLMRSMITRQCQLARVEAHFLRGRAFLRASMLRRNDVIRWHALALKDAAVLDREKTRYSAPLSSLLRACVERARGDSEAAIALFGASEDGLRQADMALLAAAARRRRGELLGGSAGEDLVRAADAWMREHGVIEPAKMTAMIAPGFAE
jgi:serine/threonine protein kinase